MKSLSCGIVITDTKFVLGCLPTNGKFYDIPKGRREEGESFRETAIRETFEETGLKVNGDNLIDLGLFQYNEKKDLYLYKYVMNRLPPIDEYHCTSYFTVGTQKVLEMEEFAYIPVTQLNQFSPNMSLVLLEVLIDYL